MPEFEIVTATPKDAKLILYYIRALAKAEEFPYPITVTQAAIEENLFAPNSNTYALLFYLDQQPCGFAVYYFSFSTTTGRKGLHLDDLYLEPIAQGLGLGKTIMKHLATLALTHQCARFEWWVLKTNVNAIRFYEKIGSQNLEELSVYRMDEEAMQKLLLVK